MNEDAYSYNILCLEDNFPEIEQAMRALQKKLKARIYIAGNYAEAEKLLSARHFDLFILDIEMKGERSTGIQLAESVRTMHLYSTVPPPILFMSIHTHFSYRTLSRFHNSAFLKKPFSADDLLLQCGVLLNIPEYVQNYYRAPVLTIPVSGQTKIEVAAQTVSYIEVNRKELTIQYMDGRLERFHCLSGAFKALLRQIGEPTACPLRQIHRAIVVNPDQIRKVEICGNTGSVWLFNDDNPKPLGIRYRHNLAEYVTDADEEEMRHAAL